MNATVKGFTNKRIINQEAAHWILLLEDTPKLSSKQIAELNDWVATSDVHRQCLESMAESWSEMDLLSKVMQPQEMKTPSSFSKTLSYFFTPIVAVYSLLLVALKQSKHLLRPLVAAPVLICTLVAVMYVIQPIQKSKTLVFSTSIGEHKSHIMPDGSTLWLNSSTQIEVHYSDDFRRVKLLNGEAHFEVAKDKTRPFEVYANDRLVRAIGTAFSVHKLNDKIEVIVSEGTVELAVVDNTLIMIPDDFEGIDDTVDAENEHADKTANTAQTKVLPTPAKVKQVLGRLSAGQRISISVAQENVSDVTELDTSEVTRSLSWKQGKLVFAGESLEDVIQEITRHTEVKIEMLDPQLKSMRIGGQFQVGETDTLFHVLESGFGISVNKLDDLHVQLLLKEK